MTNQEILTKAIEKAIAGGWKRIGLLKEIESHNYEWNERELGWVGFEERISATDFMYSQDFAKSLWGESIVHPNKSPMHNSPTPIWWLHLQQMVIADDPIKYLGANI